MICNFIAWTKMIGIVLEWAIGNTISARCTVATEAIDRVEDNGSREVPSIELLLPVPGYLV